jgi:hypothetical protein
MLASCLWEVSNIIKNSIIKTWSAPVSFDMCATSAECVNFTQRKNLSIKHQIQVKNQNKFERFDYLPFSSQIPLPYTSPYETQKTKDLYYPWIKPGKLLPHPTLQCIPPLQIDLHGRWRGTWSLVPRHTIIPGSNHRGNSSLIFWSFSHHPIFTVLATFSSTAKQMMIKTRSLAASHSETRPPRKILRCRNYNRW